MQLGEEELKDAIVLIFANKQDLPNPLSASDITEKLRLAEIKGRRVGVPHFEILFKRESMLLYLVLVLVNSRHPTSNNYQHNIDCIVFIVVHSDLLCYGGKWLV